MPIIEVDGIKYSAKYIGKGSFSKAYRVGDRVVLYTRGDCAREVLAMFGYQRLMHLPEIIRHHDIQGRGGVYYVFSMPYYKNVTKKDRSAYKLMMHIMAVWAEFWNNVIWKSGNKYQTIYTMQDFVKFARHELPYSVINALQELVDVSSNCGDNVGFDFVKSNFGVNEYGTLILRDVVWVIPGR